jgi:putative ATPase
MDLFTVMTKTSELPGTPLAEQMRPHSRADLVGQQKVLAQIERYLKSGIIPSMIFWGPPGTGKTTLAQILATEVDAEFVAINAVESGAKALKEIGEAARDRRIQYQRKTLLFVDEIHRFNKAQQDVLLPFVEKGELILVGATTENPSYELNRALLSRCRLIVFDRHTPDALAKILSRTFEQKKFILNDSLDPQAQKTLLEWADGDARRLLLGIEEVLSAKAADEVTSDASSKKEPISVDRLTTLLGQAPIGYDKQSDQHYDVISAFIKSIRGSDVDAALYYLARMLKGGEDPVFIARRLVILASEDVGNADPRALQVAMTGAQAVEMIGLPEAAINLSQVVCYIASAPKSNRSYMALKKAQAYVDQTGTPPIKLALRSSKTEAMKDLGYGKGYLYPHDHPRHWVEQDYWPETVPRESFYEPGDTGFEKQIKEYLRWLKQN